MAPNSRIETRALAADDLGEVIRIQSLCPEAAQWLPAAGEGYDALVAVVGQRVIGFLIGRRAGAEGEILNLAVDPESRRSGAASLLLARWLQKIAGPVSLEVRESNMGARLLYESIGFVEIGRRTGYYDGGSEAAIVMQRRP